MASDPELWEAMTPAGRLAVLNSCSQGEDMSEWSEIIEHAKRIERLAHPGELDTENIAYDYLAIECFHLVRRVLDIANRDPDGK